MYRPEWSFKADVRLIVNQFLDLHIVYVKNKQEHHGVTLEMTPTLSSLLQSARIDDKFVF